MSSSPGSTGSANKEARRGKTRRRQLLFTAMALRPGLVFAEVVGSGFCPLTPSRRLHCLLHRRSRPTTRILAHLARTVRHARRRHRFAEANHASDATRGAARKRIGRRRIREAGAKYGLFDRRRHVAERCVSRVVELGSRKQAGVAVSRINRALSAKRSLSRVGELVSPQPAWLKRPLTRFA